MTQLNTYSYITCRFDEVYNDNNALLIVCKPCAEVRNIFKDDCLEKMLFGGMNDFHLACIKPDTRVITF